MLHLNEDCEVSFKGDNPGAVRYGNFINYYRFHPAENRIKLFPDNIWPSQDGNICVCMDVGCNSGELTVALLKFFQDNVNKSRTYHLLGIDIDPVLIQRAQETVSEEHIEYKCVDIMKESKREIIREYLDEYNKGRFDVTFCLSVTMWIHLNHGDDGLKRFLQYVCDVSEMVAVEPQPWKCYRTAVKRLREANSDFPLFKQLKYRQNVELVIEQILEDCKFVKVVETPLTNWGRKILFYKRGTE